MRRAGLTIVSIAVVGLLSGCFGDEEKEVKAPAKDFVMVVNKAAVDYQIQVTTRLKAKFLLPYKGELQISFPATSSKVVQVKARSVDPNWNDCITSVKVGQTMEVVQVGEIVECQVK